MVLGFDELKEDRG